MGLLELIVLSIGLAMDAFSVAICKGLAMTKMKWKNAIIIGAYFGIFQAVMPLIGYAFGMSFQSIIKDIDHWVAFILLVGIGLNMIKEAVSSKKESNSVYFKEMLVLAIATSIDALAVGVTLAFLQVNIILAICIIGIITFTISIVGVKIGNIFGDKYEKKAEIAGGTILILLGTKILLEHLQII